MSLKSVPVSIYLSLSFFFQGSLPLCEALLQKGCDVNEVASFPPFNIKMSPLSYAVTQFNKEMVRFLLKHGCDPTITDDFG